MISARQGIKQSRHGVIRPGITRSVRQDRRFRVPCTESQETEHDQSGCWEVLETMD